MVTKGIVEAHEGGEKVLRTPEVSSTPVVVPVVNYPTSGAVFATFQTEVLQAFRKQLDVSMEATAKECERRFGINPADVSWQCWVAKIQSQVRTALEECGRSPKI